MTKNNTSYLTGVTLTLSCLLLIPVAALAQQTSAQQTGTVTGRVVDAATGESVIGATVLVVGTPAGVRALARLLDG